MTLVSVFSLKSLHVNVNEQPPIVEDLGMPVGQQQHYFLTDTEAQTNDRPLQTGEHFPFLSLELSGQPQNSINVPDVPMSTDDAQILSMTSTASPVSTVKSSVATYSAVTQEEADNALTWTLPNSLVGGTTNIGMWENRLDSCDETGGDLQFVRHEMRYENRITICDDGPTVVECLLDSKDGIPTKGKGKRAPKGLDPIVRFCFAKNLFPPALEDRSNCPSNEPRERDGCHWTMYCRPSGYWKEQGGGVDAPMFRGMGNAFNWMATGTLRREDPENAPSPFNEGTPTESEPILHYIAFGDCGGET